MLDPEARLWVHEVAMQQLRAEWRAHQARMAELEDERPRRERLRHAENEERERLERGAARRATEAWLMAHPPRAGMTKFEIKRWAFRRAKEMHDRPMPTPQERRRLRYARMAFAHLAFEKWVEQGNDPEDY
jgi:hypothetical protein